MLQSKLGTEVGIPEVYPQLLLVQKGMVVDGTPKLPHDDWVREQAEVEVDFLWNRTVDSLKTSFLPLLWTSSGLKGWLKDNTLYGEWQAHLACPEPIGV